MFTEDTVLTAGRGMGFHGVFFISMDKETSDSKKPATVVSFFIYLLGTLERVGMKSRIIERFIYRVC